MPAPKKTQNGTQRSSHPTDSNQLTLEWLPGQFAIVRLEPGPPLPPWCQINESAPSPRSGLLSITRTANELSIVIDEVCVPADVKAQRGFAGVRIAGTLDFSIVGVLAKLTGALAEAKVPVFAISTHDTDVLLIRAGDTQRARLALQKVARLEQ